MAPYLSDLAEETQLFPQAPGYPTPFAMQDKSMPIAIVGMSLRGPADATSVENLWKMISEKREGWTKIPQKRWNNEAFYHPNSARNGTVSIPGTFDLRDPYENNYCDSIMWRQDISFPRISPISMLHFLA